MAVFRSAKALLPPNEFGGCHLTREFRRTENFDRHHIWELGKECCS